VLVILVVVAAVIVGAVAVVAMGQGGEMARFVPDDPPDAPAQSSADYEGGSGRGDPARPGDHDQRRESG
jgi:uncharacterized membrane protein YdfJ with MMPL/SSD domain